MRLSCFTNFNVRCNRIGMHPYFPLIPCFCIQLHIHSPVSNPPVLTPCNPCSLDSFCFFLSSCPSALCPSVPKIQIMSFMLLPELNHLPIMAVLSDFFTLFYELLVQRSPMLPHQASSIVLDEPFVRPVGLTGTSAPIIWLPHALITSFLLLRVSYLQEVDNVHSDASFQPHAL